MQKRTTKERIDHAGLNFKGMLWVLLTMFIVVGAVSLVSTTWKNRPIVFDWKYSVVEYTGTSVTLDVEGRYLRNDCEFIFGSERGYIKSEGSDSFRLARYTSIQDPGLESSDNEVQDNTVFKPPLLEKFRFGLQQWANDRDGARDITEVYTTFDHICDGVVIQEKGHIEIIGDHANTQTTRFGPVEVK